MSQDGTCGTCGVLLKYRRIHVAVEYAGIATMDGGTIYYCTPSCLEEALLLMDVTRINLVFIPAIGHKYPYNTRSRRPTDSVLDFLAWWRNDGSKLVAKNWTISNV